MIVIPVNSWTDFKALCITSKNLNIQYVETAEVYRLFGPDSGAITWTVTLLKDAGVDVTDFETNYKPSANGDLDLATTSAVISTVLPPGAATEATLALIKAKTDNLDVALSTRTDPSDTQPISAVALPLPTGASTSALQTTGNTSLSSIDTKLTDGTQKTKLVDSGGVNVATVSAAGAQNVDGSAVTQPVSAASLPLPTGAATEAKQDTGNSSLSSINTNAGAAADAAVTTDSSGTLSSKLRGLVKIFNSVWDSVNSRLNFNLSSWMGSTVPTVGQKAMADSIPVTFASDQTGLPIVLTETQAVAYSAAVRGLVLAASATDIFTVTGSSTKIIKITSLTITGLRTSAGYTSIFVLKRSTANTGGTSTTLTNVPYDSADPAATAVVKAYTANPTLGTLIGSLRVERRLVDSAGGGNFAPIFDLTFGGLNNKPIILNNDSEVLTINLNSTTINGGTFDIWVEWVEV